MSRVTVLGLGAMGSRMAVRLAEAGHTVTVWNRSPQPASRLRGNHDISIADTARAAAGAADVVLSMVTDDDASRSLWLDADHGALGAVPEHGIVVEASTITSGWAVELGATVAATGRRFVEAPVVGSRPQADAGALLVLAGGDPDIVDHVRPVLDAFAGSVRHVGPTGSAATTKLVVNGLFATQVAAYAEAVGLLRRGEVADDVVTDLLPSLPITSPGLQRILGLVERRDFAPNFPLDLVAKDLRYLAHLADELGAPVPVTAAVRGVVGGAVDDGRGGLDISGLAGLYLH